MRTFQGQDLTSLFLAMAADDGVPFFEIVVEDVLEDTDDDDDDDSILGLPNDVVKNERWG